MPNHLNSMGELSAAESQGFVPPKSGKSPSDKHIHHHPTQIDGLVGQVRHGHGQGHLNHNSISIKKDGRHKKSISSHSPTVPRSPVQTSAEISQASPPQPAPPPPVTNGDKTGDSKDSASKCSHVMSNGCWDTSAIKEEEYEDLAVFQVPDATTAVGERNRAEASLPRNLCLKPSGVLNDVSTSFFCC